VARRETVGWQKLQVGRTIVAGIAPALAALLLVIVSR
jgi:hypothetical protein